LVAVGFEWITTTFSLIAAVDSLWGLSWHQFLRLYGTSRWARGPHTDNGSDSLRGLIAFSVDPEPSKAEVEEIIRCRTLRWTIQRSSPQYFVIAEIVYNVPRLRKFYASLDVGANDFTVLLAAAAEGYFRREMRVSGFKAVLKLHYSKFEDFIRLRKQERSVVQRLMDTGQYAKPIYPWQGENAILNEEWAGCLGVADTRSFFALIERLWKQNPEVRRILDAGGIELLKPECKTHHFRDFGISCHLMNLWSRKIRFFQQPCVFRRWE
jgi:hypothetical protein